MFSIKSRFGSIQVRKFYLLEFAGLPNIIKTRGAGLVRKGLVSDIPEMANLDYYGKQGIFVDRFSSGDHCVAAVANGNIIGYEWFSCNLSHREERYLYTIPVPDNAIYAYDAFLVPAYRGSGVWIKFKKYLGELMRAQARRRIITLIDAENRLSLNTHIRFGFTACSSIVLIKVFNTRYFRKKRFDLQSFKGPEI